MSRYSQVKWFGLFSFLFILFTVSTVFADDQMMITTSQHETYYLPESAATSLPSQIGTLITDDTMTLTPPTGLDGSLLYPLQENTSSIAESILATDERTHITNTATFPYSATVFITATFSNGATYIGSGAMVSSDGVLTAGHMIYSAANGGWATNVTIYPGLNGTTAPFGSAKSIKLFSVTEWTNKQDPTQDIGLIRLDRPIGYKTGWFGLSTSATPNETVQTTGFPAEKGETMWKSTGKIDTIENSRIYYDLDTTSGQSGSPVYNANRTLLATHTYGGSQVNFGTRINSTVLAWIESDTHHYVANFRLYNRNSGEHFFTTNATEYQALVNLGWRAEGVAWFATATGDEVYRLYNPNSGKHFYTKSVTEKQYLVRLGWHDEGVAYHVVANGIPVYRLYNKNDGRHFYTSSLYERNSLVQLGWRAEGVAWYGLG